MFYPFFLARVFDLLIVVKSKKIMLVKNIADPNFQVRYKILLYVSHKRGLKQHKV